MSQNSELDVIVIDRNNFRKVCRANGITSDCLMFNRIIWRLAKLEQLEDAGLVNCDAAEILRGELNTLFNRLTTNLFGASNV